MKIEKVKNISEDIESSMQDLNKNIKRPNDMEKVVAVNPVYGDAIEDDKEAEEHVGKVFAEKGKEVKDVTLDAPSTGKKVKNEYTEQMKLDESLFEDFGSTVADVRQFLKDSVDWLLASDEGCSTLRLNDRLAICVGWENGFDPDDEYVIHSTSDPEYGIVAGIKVWTSDDMLTDYEWINAPYYEDGDVVDISATVSENEDYNQLASFFVEEYEKLKDLDIDEDGKILEGEEEVEVEVEDETLNEMTDTELDKSKKEFRDEQAKLGVGWFGPERMKYVPLPDEMKKREKEFACIDMINSILAYSPKRSIYTAEEILEDDLGSYHSYLKDYVDALGKEKVIELIKGQMDDIEDVDTDVYTDGEGVSYNSIRWKEKSSEKELDEAKVKYVEDLPDTVFQLAFDRLFPDTVKNYKTLIVSDNPSSYNPYQHTNTADMGDYDIGVYVKDEEDGKLAKDVADFLKLDYEYKEVKGKDGFNGLAIIHMSDKIGETPTDVYLKSIGYDGPVRVDPNAYKKEKKNESVSGIAKSTLDESAKVIVDFKDYVPWSGAKDWYNIIEEQGKLDALDSFLEELYPEGIEDVELNDLLWFEPEYVFDAIGIKYDFINDKLITDDEEVEEEDEVEEVEED